MEFAGASLAPDFSSDVTAYTGQTSSPVIALGASAQEANAKVTLSVNDSVVAHGVKNVLAEFALAEGDNTLNLTVTSPDGTTTKDYTVVMKASGKVSLADMEWKSETAVKPTEANIIFEVWVDDDKRFTSTEMNKKTAAASTGKIDVSGGKELKLVARGVRNTWSAHANWVNPVLTAPFERASVQVGAVSNDEAMGTATVDKSEAIAAGETFTATATPKEGHEFVGWLLNDSTEVFSTEAVYTAKAYSSMVLTAKFAPKQAQPVEPKLSIAEAGSVESPTVQRGGTISFLIEGLKPHETVNVTVHSDPINLGDIAADANGVIRKEWAVPADFPGGAHRLVVTGSFGTAEMPFTVADAPTGNTGDTGTDNSGTDNTGTTKPQPGKDTKPGKTGTDKPTAQGKSTTDKKTTVLATTGSTAPVFLAGVLLLAAVGASITVTCRKRGQ